MSVSRLICLSVWLSHPFHLHPHTRQINERNLMMMMMMMHAFWPKNLYYSPAACSRMRLCCVLCLDIYHFINAIMYTRAVHWKHRLYFTLHRGVVDCKRVTLVTGTTQHTFAYKNVLKNCRPKIIKQRAIARFMAWRWSSMHHIYTTNYKYI